LAVPLYIALLEAIEPIASPVNKASRLVLTGCDSEGARICLM